MEIDDDHDATSDLLYICQPCDEPVGTVNNALLEIGMAHATMTHIATEEGLELEKALQAKASDSESQAVAQILRTPASLFAYDQDGVLVR